MQFKPVEVFSPVPFPYMLHHYFILSAIFLRTFDHLKITVHPATVHASSQICGKKWVGTGDFHGQNILYKRFKPNETSHVMWEIVNCQNSSEVPLGRRKREKWNISMM